MKKEMKRNIFAIVSVLIISIAIIMVSKSIFPDGFIEDRYGKGAEFYNGVITEIIEEDLNKDPILDGVEIGYQKVIAKVTEGQYKDNTYEIKNNIIENIKGALSPAAEAKSNEILKYIIACNFDIVYVFL